MASVLEISKATKSYTLRAPVLRNINLNVQPAKLVALIGASKSRNSTMIRLISGMEQVPPALGGS